MLGEFHGFKAIKNGDGSYSYPDFSTDWIDFQNGGSATTFVLAMSEDERVFINFSVDEAKKLRTLLTRSINESNKFKKQVKSLRIENRQSTSLTATI